MVRSANSSCSERERRDLLATVHYEAEVCVVIGKRGKNIPEAEVKEYVFGVTPCNDVSERGWQKADLQWFRAKGSDTFLPMGPILVTADEVDPAAGLRLRSWRIDGNGAEHLMQDGTTADMLFDIPAAIEFVSRAITLEPGDVLATGTPERRRRVPRPAHLP